MLVKKCLCGLTVDHSFQYSKIYNISILKCPGCKILHQKVNLSEEEYQDFYKTKYHVEHQEKIGQTRYDARYDHDKEIAEQRMIKYEPFLKGARLLDIGASNGAFVDVAREYGMDAWGIELAESFDRPEIMYQGTLAEQKFEAQEFDNITMHDVLEHVIDPVAEIKEVHRVLSVNGVLIVDIPDYYDPSGTHHWRPIEHLWFFDKDQCGGMIEQEGFKVVKIDKPIPSKIVIYAEKTT